MRKPVAALLLAIMLIGSLILFDGFNSGTAQAAGVSGIISSDTTWTSVTSLTGNVLVDYGVTVTVQQGATINLNGYYIRVNGTLFLQSGVTVNMGSTGENVGYMQINGALTARGTSQSPIRFNGASHSWDSIFVPLSLSYVSFAASSSPWNEQTSSGCIIEYAVMDMTGMSTASSIRFSSNQLSSAGISLNGGSPVVSNNVFHGSMSIAGGSPIVSNNQFMNGYIWVDGSSGVDSPVISSNVISNPNPEWPYATSAGIAVLGYPYSSGSMLIENNIIRDSAAGINLIYREKTDINKPITIQHNTIVNNTVGIFVEGRFTPTVTNNNIYNNQQSVKMGSGASRDISVAQNWWGTTDISAIDNSITDFNDDFNLGKVTYQPILTSHDQQAPDLNQPIPQATLLAPTPANQSTNQPAENLPPMPSQLGTQTLTFPSLNRTEIAIIVLLVVVAVLLVVDVLYRRKKRYRAI